MPSWSRMRLTGNQLTLVVPVVSAMILVAGCGASMVSRIGTPERVDHPIRAVALTPDDTLSRAIGGELRKRGYTVLDEQQTTTLLDRRKAGALELMTPEVLAALSEGGVDAVFSTTGVDSIAGHIRTGTVRVTSTSTSRVVGAVSWKNAWGGVPGSPADRIMRKDMSEAAQEIVDALSEQLPPPAK